MQIMKIPQQTFPVDSAVIEREPASSSSSTQETIPDRTRETIPLNPKQLQQFLQQLNWQERDLAAVGISSALLAEELSRSWYSRLNHWLLREPLLFKILQWPFSKRWPTGSVFPTDNGHLLKRIYGTNGYLEGTDLMLNKVWSSLLLSFLVVDIFNYYYYPNLRYGNTFLKVFLAQTDNQQMLSNVLTLPEAWPILLGTPILWGTLKAFLSARHAKALDKESYRTLLETLGHYQASLWKDIGRWILPSLLPEFVPNLALFALLPEPKLKLALESAERLLLWDRRISPDERRILLQQVQVLARKATHITQLKALTTLAKVADGTALNDLARLSRQGVDAQTLKSLLWVKQQAKQTLQQVTKNPSTQLSLSSMEMEPLISYPLKDDKLATPSRSRYLYTHYLLWTLGQPHNYRLQPLFWSYLAFQMYFKARFFYLLGRGMHDTLRHYWDKWQCESEGRLWSYFNERSEWSCSICGDLPLFYNDVFDEKTCWDAYIKSPQPVDKLVELIKRLSFVNLPTIDLSRQRLADESLITVLDALRPKGYYIQILLLNNSAFLNTPAIQAIADFLQHSTVTELNLRYRQIQDIDTQWLARSLPHSPIRSLNLGNTHINAEGAKGLAQGLPGSKVQYLDLRSNNISDEGAKGLAQGLPGSQVQYLDLRANNIGDEGTKELAQRLPGSQVQSLGLQANNIYTEGAKELAQVLPDSHIRYLDLQSNKIGAEGTKRLALALLDSQVQYLDLRSNNISAEGTKELAQVLPDSPVQYLDLSYNNIRTEGAKGLAQGLPGSQVQSLYLSGNNIDPEGAKELAQVLPDSPVQYLDLGYNNIGNEGVKELAQGLPGSQVQSLNLRFNNIDDEGAKELALGLPDSQLQFLDLRANNIGDEGAEGLAQGLPGSQVQSLDLSYNNIRTEGAKGLAQGLPGSQVQSLDLLLNNIGPEGAKGLALGLPGSQVQSLKLRFNNIGAEGAKGLALGLPDSKVQFLDLGFNYIGDEGVKELAQGLSGSQVQSLDLGFNNIGTEGAKRLAQGLPGSQVQFLELNYNNLGNEGAKELFQGLPSSQVQSLGLDFTNIGDEGSLALADVMVKGSLNTHDLANILTPDAKKALARAEPNTLLEALWLSSNNISTQGALTLCLVLPQTYININQLSLDNNLINSSQVDPQTCFISSSAVSLQPTGPYVTLYHLYQTSLCYAIKSYQYISAHWLTASTSPFNTVEEVSIDSTGFLPKEITINEPPVINKTLSEKNEDKPSFTFKIAPTIPEPAMTAVRSSFLEPNSPSKNPFSFFNTLASPHVTTQPLNSSLSALPKPSETLPTMNTLGAIGATVTSMLAVGCWLWKNCKRSNYTVPTFEKRPQIKTSKTLILSD
jgi:Ran GTPase-activating protein (RanGAP) involved in mRNA processing and transport